MTELIFLSYAREDGGAFSLELAKDLKKARLDVWIDQLDIAAGDSWDRKVEEALARAGKVLVVLTPGAIASENVLDEIAYAIDGGKRVFPVLYRRCDVPLRLRRLQYVDFTGEYPAALEELIGRLRAPAHEPEAPSGWRPSTGRPLPGRPHWELDRKLGQGGFGEVWRASHRKTGDLRVFKFCYAAERLRSLKREITLFRLLKEELGARDDITRILDWNFEQPPYFIESEYAAEGNLIEWAETRGGLAEVPLATRLELLAQASEALAAAHSVGVLHTDVKPANLLIDRGPDGCPRAQLTDFGVGKITERGRLKDAGITELGMTAPADDGSSGTGTRLYTAPEILEGKPASLQADIYALGVILYQLAVGDFRRALATGWRREVEDPLLCEDIAYAVDGSPRRRLGNALRLAERLRSLDRRREERRAEERRREQAARLELAVARSRRRLVAGALAMLFVTLVAAVRMLEARRTAREAATARQVSRFLVELFEVTNPFAVWPGDQGPDVTARELLSRGADRVQQELADQPEIQARLLSTMGAAYLGLGLYDESRKLLDAALDVQRELFPDRHPDLASTRRARGEVLAIQGELDAARRDLREALEIRRHLPGAHDLEIAETSTLLGEVLTALNEFEEAERILREAVGIQRRADHPDLALSLTVLADLLRARGRLDEARASYREALDVGRRAWDPEHPHVATALNGLGFVAHLEARYDDAGRLYRQALDIRLRHLGEDHLHVDLSRNNLATLLVSRGDAAAAEPLFRRSLEVRRERLGEGHPEVGVTVNNLAFTLAELGRYREAEPLFRHALEIWRASRGEKHSRIVGALINLAGTLRELGELEAGELTAARALGLRRELPSDPTGLADAHRAVAEIAHAQGRFEAAKAGYRQARENFLTSLPENHPAIAKLDVGLGRLLAERGDVASALELLRGAVEVLRGSYVEGYWRTAEAESLLGGCLATLGLFDEAEPLVLAAFENLREGLGADARRTREARERIDELHRARERACS